MLMEQLKKLLGKLRLPADTLKLVAGADSPGKLTRQLDELITANELEYRKLQKEIAELERQERGEVDDIRSGKLGSRSRKVALMNVRRLRRQADGLEGRLRIHDDNMKLHLALLGKVQSLEAMDMRGVEEKQVDAIAVEFQEEFERYSAAIEAGSALTDDALSDDSETDQEIVALEAEILGEKAAPSGETAAGDRKGERTGVPEPSKKGKESGKTAARQPEAEDDQEKEAAWD